MRALYSLVFILIIICDPAYNQISMSTDGSLPDPSAILDVRSTSQGLLLPRMTFDERSAIINPADGLIVFCTNCGLDETGMLCVFTDGEWFSFSLCKISTPTASVNQLLPSSIVWTWNPVPGAAGYKWGLTNSYTAAIDMGTDTSTTEMGILCDSLYSRYVWAYSNCGYSVPLNLTQLTGVCFICGDTLNIDHIAGNVAPVNKTTTYYTLLNVPGEPSKCWITSNLGSDHQAVSPDDNTEASAGWYWQFNLMKGFKHDGAARTPNTTWINLINEYSNWESSKDPCALELGTGWRIPTRIEWLNVVASGNWNNYSGPWASILKMHMAGYLYFSDGSLTNRGSNGIYWTSTQSSEVLAWRLLFHSSSCSVINNTKPFGNTVRCIKD